jgi:hypothetical protein
LYWVPSRSRRRDSGRRRAIARGEQRPDHPGDIVGEPRGAPRVTAPQIGEQQAAQLGVGAGDGPIQPPRREHDGVLLGAEPDRAAEQARVRRGIDRPPMRQRDLGRPPFRSA